jgi:ADP-ribose pyrophosphatase
MNPETKTLFSSKYLEVRQTGKWVYAHRPGVTGIVIIVAVTDDREILLVEQYRVPVASKVLELPAGLVGDSDSEGSEDLVTGARRELLEETGYEAGQWEELFTGPPTAGMTTEVVTFFRASQLRSVNSGGGVEGENITVHRIPLSNIEEWLKQKQTEGFLIDPKVYAGLYFTDAKVG